MLLLFEGKGSGFPLLACLICTPKRRNVLTSLLTKRSTTYTKTHLPSNGRGQGFAGAAATGQDVTDVSFPVILSRDTLLVSEKRKPKQFWGTSKEYTCDDSKESGGTYL